MPDLPSSEPGAWRRTSVYVDVLQIRQDDGWKKAICIFRVIGGWTAVWRWFPRLPLHCKIWPFSLVNPRRFYPLRAGALSAQVHLGGLRRWRRRTGARTYGSHLPGTRPLRGWAHPWRTYFRLWRLMRHNPHTGVWTYVVLVAHALWMLQQSGSCCIEFFSASWILTRF